MTAFAVELDSLPMPHKGLQPEVGATYDGTSRRWTILSLATAGCFGAFSPTALDAYQIIKSPLLAPSNIFTRFRPDPSVTSDEWVKEVPAISRPKVTEADWTARLVTGVWTHRAAARIHELAGRDVGWKGEGSTPPGQSVVHDGLALIQRLQAEGCTLPPMISAEEDGDLIFFWKKNGTWLSMSLGGDQKYNFFAKHDGKSKIGDGVRISEPFPTSILLAFTGLRSEQA